MRSVLLRVAGAVIALSAAAHAGAWTMVKLELSFAGVADALDRTLAAGWLFGSLAMAVFGILVFRAGVRLARGDGSGLEAVRVIAAAYVLFGTAAFLVRGPNAHFLGFIVLGLLAGLPAVGAGAGGTGRR